MLQTIVQCDKYDSRNFTDVPVLDSIVVEGEDRIALFAVNRDLNEDIEVGCDLRQYKDYKLAKHIVLTGPDLYAFNTEADPDRVAPSLSSASSFEDGMLKSVMPSKSWNVVVLEK